MARIVECGKGQWLIIIMDLDPLHCVICCCPFNIMLVIHLSSFSLFKTTSFYLINLTSITISTLWWVSLNAGERLSLKQLCGCRQLVYGWSDMIYKTSAYYSKRVAIRSQDCGLYIIAKQTKKFIWLNMSLW